MKRRNFLRGVLFAALLPMASIGGAIVPERLKKPVVPFSGIGEYYTFSHNWIGAPDDMKVCMIQNGESVELEQGRDYLIDVNTCQISLTQTPTTDMSGLTITRTKVNY